MSTVAKPIAVPAYTFRLRAAQFIIAIVILILNIVSTALLGGFASFGFGFFACISTCIIVAYWYFASYPKQQYYNRWALLVLDILSVIWWLSAWSLLAQWAAAIGVADEAVNEIDDAYGIAGNSNLGLVHALTAIAAVLGAAEFVLFIVTFVTFSISLHRVRQNEFQSSQHGPVFANRNYQEMNPGMNNGMNNNMNNGMNNNLNKSPLAAVMTPEV